MKITILMVLARIELETLRLAVRVCVWHCSDCDDPSATACIGHGADRGCCADLDEVLVGNRQPIDNETHVTRITAIPALSSLTRAMQCSSNATR